MNKNLISIVLLVIVLCITIYYKFFNNNEPFQENCSVTESIGQFSNVCSKLCCFSGWPNSVIINDNDVSQSDIGTIYKTSNYTCNNGFTTGCVCEKI
jgi:hypothetical protein